MIGFFILDFLSPLLGTYISGVLVASRALRNPSVPPTIQSFKPTMMLGADGLGHMGQDGLMTVRL